MNYLLKTAVSLTFILSIIGCQHKQEIEKRKQASQIIPMSQDDFLLGKEMLQIIQNQAEKRIPLTSYPHVFIRSQTKYSGRLYQNHYLWHDRPLFANRRLWDKSRSDHKHTSYKKTFELYQQYGVSGFATFAWPGQYKYDNIIQPLYATARKMKLNPGKFNIMLEVAPYPAYLSIVPDTLKEISNNPYSFRIGGKSVISSYVVDKLSADQLKPYVLDLKKRSNNKIIFLPQIFFGSFKYRGKPFNIYEIHELYLKNDAVLPNSLLSEMKEYLRTYARVCDGLYLGHVASNHDTSLDDSFSGNILYPLFKSVLAEDEFNGKKIFGAVARVGYTSYHGTQSLSRQGTKTMCKLFELALKYKPDILICPEWDELNEDTGFQPLLAKPMSSQRIIKYYMSRLKGKAPGPNPGDNLEIPNLIISQRRQLVPGWTMDIELLNVPDTSSGDMYTVKYELLDGSGNVLFPAPKVLFNSSEMKEHTFKLASEKFKNAHALRSRLSIEYKGRKHVYCDGLPFTVLRPTTCWDQTYFCTPLRNVLPMEKADISFNLPGRIVASGISEVDVSASIRTKEKIAAVEVVQDSLEIFVYDSRNEYLQNDQDRRLYKLSWNYVNNPTRIPITFDVKLENASSARTFSHPVYGAQTAGYNSTQPAVNSPAFTDKFDKWNKNRYNGCADHWARNRIISLTKRDADKAVLIVSGRRTKGKNEGERFKWQIPFKKLGEYGVVSTIFKDGLMFALSTEKQPPNHPLPLDSGEVTFSSKVMVDNPYAVLAVRVVSEQGNVYWSKPFSLIDKKSSETVPIAVYSDLEKKSIYIDSPKNRVPAITYDFTPENGAVLRAHNGREFNGHAGGYFAIATGFTGLEAMNFTIPFLAYTHSIFKGADKPAPEWVRCKDGWALHFDGERGNFLTLPPTVIPQRAGFTLSFDLKPEELKPYQVIFANEGKTFGGLVISVKNGFFQLTYKRRTPHNPVLPVWSVKTFDTTVPLYTGKWQKVSVSYDGSTITISANDKKESFPLQGIGLYLQQSHFGGRGVKNSDGTIPFYKGLLKGLEIKHYPQKN